MPAKEPTFWELVLEAFHRKPVVRGLGAVSWNKVLLVLAGILGFGNPGFWLLGIAGELAYLYVSATSPRFRALVRAKKLEAGRRTAEEQVERWLEELSPNRKLRFAALRASCLEIQRVYETLRPGGLSVVDEQRWQGLDQLLWVYLRLSVSLELLEKQTDRLDPVELQDEIRALRQELEATPSASEALRKSRQSLLELKERRLANLGRAAEARQVFTSELQRIEQQVELLREEAAIARNAEHLSTRIDSVAGLLSENDSWMREHEELLSNLGFGGATETPQILPRAAAVSEAGQ